MTSPRIITDELPADILFYILSKLNFSDLITIKYVSKIWKQIAYSYMDRIQNELSNPIQLLNIVQDAKPEYIFEINQHIFRPIKKSTAYINLKREAEKKNPSLEALIAYSIVTNDIRSLNFQALESLYKEHNKKYHHLNNWWNSKKRNYFEKKKLIWISEYNLDKLTEDDAVKEISRLAQSENIFHAYYGRRLQKFTLENNYEILELLTPEEKSDLNALIKLAFLMIHCDYLLTLKMINFEIDLSEGNWFVNNQDRSEFYLNCANVKFKDIYGHTTTQLFSYINFENANFSNIHFPTMIFKGCNLNGADFSKSSFRGLSLIDSNCQNIKATNIKIVLSHDPINIDVFLVLTPSLINYLKKNINFSRDHKFITLWADALLDAKQDLGQFKRRLDELYQAYEVQSDVIFKFLRKELVREIKDFPIEFLQEAYHHPIFQHRDKLKDTINQEVNNFINFFSITPVNYHLIETESQITLRRLIENKNISIIKHAI